MKVLIVGGGIGGLALAAFLADSGIEYDVVEKCPDWKHQGYLVAIWDNGRDILNKLGLADAFDALGQPIKSFSGYDGSGNVIRTGLFSELYEKYGGAVTIIDRGELHKLLLQKVGIEKIRMGTVVESLREEGDYIVATFPGGEQKQYDVVVGADGIHSSVRSQFFKKGAEKYTNWRAWYAWVDNTFGQPDAITELVEPRELVVLFSAKGRTAAGFFAPVDHTVWDDTEGRIGRLKMLFARQTKMVPAAFANLVDGDIMPTDLIDIELPSWVAGRAVLLGDAAHSYGPIAGMGCSMAMEDAYVLAASLIRAAAGEPLGDMLHRYEKHRKPRVALVKKMTRLNRAALLVKSPLLRKSIDLVMRLAPPTPPGATLQKLLKEEI